MSLIIPNLDRITKDDVKTGEALKKVQDYTNQAVPAATGNAVVAPPASTSPAPSQQAATPTTVGPNPRVPAPQRSGVPQPNLT